MMFVAGEVAEPLPETTGLIEDIVRAQVVEMVNLPFTILNAYSRLFKLLHRQHEDPQSPSL